MNDMIIDGRPPLRVLVVDDWQSRHALIRRVFSDSHTPACLEYRFGPEYVTDQDIETADVIFLDHDMCQAQYGACPNPVQGGSLNFLDENCGCPTGRDLVVRLTQQARRPRCVVHTANFVGGRVMVEGLRAAGFPVVQSPADWRLGHLARSVVDSWKLYDI